MSVIVFHICYAYCSVIWEVYNHNINNMIKNKRIDDIVYHDNGKSPCLSIFSYVFQKYQLCFLQPFIMTNENEQNVLTSP